VRFTRWCLAPALALLLFGGGVFGAEVEKRPPKERPTFGVLQAVTPEQARTRAEAWLKKAGKTDPDSRKAFAAIWETDRPTLDKVARTLQLGSPAAAKLLAQARDADSPAPTEVPSILKDKKVDPFLKANLALAYARQLANRRVFDEALGALEEVRPEDVVAPGAYLFTKAVCEHSLMLKDDAGETIDRLLVDVPAAPERYRMVGALMHFDMLTWQDKDLGWVARKMGVIKDRLEIDRGGKKTQRMQKEVVVRLDEMIKKLENQQAGNSQCNGGS
jgi:hypothetical protein